MRHNFSIIMGCLLSSFIYCNYAIASDYKFSGEWTCIDQYKVGNELRFKETMTMKIIPNDNNYYQSGTIEVSSEIEPLKNSILKYKSLNSYYSQGDMQISKTENFEIISKLDELDIFTKEAIESISDTGTETKSKIEFLSSDSFNSTYSDGSIITCNRVMN